MRYRLRDFASGAVDFSRIALVIVIAVLVLVITAVYTDSVDARIKADKVAAHVEQLQDDRITLDLAIEFGFDPIIVQVTRQLARNAFRENACDCPTWRFVKTDYELTYIILSLAQAESGGDFRAYNPSGASGLTQLLFSTARQYDAELKPGELFTIPKHLQIATTHFVSLLKKYHGNTALAVISWNRGAGAVDRLIALGQSPENNYAYTVFTRAAARNAAR